MLVVGGQWHFDPDSYLAMVREEIADYDDLQSRLAAATALVPARRILDLGSGTGVTARQVLAVHETATLVGVDASDDMLQHARRLVPEATFSVGTLDDALPEGPWDLVVSAFAIHHLDGPAKADLFARIAAALAPGGRFAMCDVVIPITAVEQPVPLEDGVDRPSSVEDQLAWLAATGLDPAVVYARDDVAIVVADRPAAG